MISGYLVGDRQLLARMSALPTRVKADMDNTVRALGYELQARVQRDYLSGQVLKVRTGRLRTSITQGQPDSRSRFESTPLTSYAYVGTNVSYGRIWEYEGIPAHDVVPVRAKALRFVIGGEVLFRKRARIPAQGPRPFLKPALAAIAPFARAQMASSLQRAAQAALKGF